MHPHIGRHPIGASSHRSEGHKVPLRNCSARCRWLALLTVIRLQEEYINVLRCKVESFAIEMRIMPIHEYILWSLRPTVLHELCAYLIKEAIAVLVTGWCSMNDPVARKSRRLEF